jgi:hypothetical protein
LVSFKALLPPRENVVVPAPFWTKVMREPGLIPAV